MTRAVAAARSIAAAPRLAGSSCPTAFDAASAVWGDIAGRLPLRRRWRWGAAVGSILAVSGCSQLPSRIPMPALNPRQAADRAMEIYDQDSDRRLSGDELARCPALKKALPQIDKDGDAAISPDELATRMQDWIDRKHSLHVLPVQVNLGGQPLVGATVRFIPEPFLPESFKAAEGMTNKYGTANMVHAPQDRPDPSFPQGIRGGFYRVEISLVRNGREILPAKYNTATELGQEVAADAGGMTTGMLRFNLRP